MADRQSLWRTLPRIYFWGWVALAPLVFFAGLIGYMSYDRQFEYFRVGLWIGILNLGILWTALFGLIALVKLAHQIARTRKGQSASTADSFIKEFLNMYPLGWTLLVAAGFVAEYVAHTFTTRGSLLMTVAVGFVPMTLGIALIAFARRQGRSSPEAAGQDRPGQRG